MYSDDAFNSSESHIVLIWKRILKFLATFFFNCNCFNPHFDKSWICFLCGWRFPLLCINRWEQAEQYLIFIIAKCYIKILFSFKLLSIDIVYSGPDSQRGKILPVKNNRIFYFIYDVISALIKCLNKAKISIKICCWKLALATIIDIF